MYEHVEGFVAAAHLNPDAPAEKLISAVTSVVPTVPPGAQPNICVQVYYGEHASEEEGDRIELPLMTWAFVIRHVRTAMQQALMPEQDGSSATEV